MKFLDEIISGLYKDLSYKDVHKACSEIYNDMLGKFSPDYILGIDGGGCVVAAVLQQFLEKPMIQFAADRTNPKDPKFPKDGKLFELLKKIIGSEKVLLVDDLSDSSHTLRRAKNLFEEVDGDVRIAVISKPSLERARNRNVDLSLYNYFPRVDPTRPEGKWDHDGKCTVHFPWDVWGHVGE